MNAQDAQRNGQAIQGTCVEDSSTAKIANRLTQQGRPNCSEGKVETNLGCRVRIGPCGGGKAFP